MANEVFKRVTVSGPADDISAFVEQCFAKQKDGSLAFNFAAITPIPDALDESEYENWQDWRIQNWGTKWHAGGTSFSPGHPAPGATELLFFFDTATVPPLPILLEASQQFPTLRFQAQCKDVMMNFVGAGEFSAGSCSFKFRNFDENDELYQRVISEEAEEDELFDDLVNDRPNDEIIRMP